MADLMGRPPTSAGAIPSRTDQPTARLQTAVYDRVRAGPGVTTRKLAAELDVPERRVRAAADRLVAEGLLERDGRKLVAPTPATYGQRCRSVRRRRGWTQRELARHLLPLLDGPSSVKSVQSSVSAIEHGRTPGDAWQRALDVVLADGWTPPAPAAPAPPVASEQEPEPEPEPTPEPAEVVDELEVVRARLVEAHGYLFEVGRLLDQVLDEEHRVLPLPVKAALVAGELRGRRGA